MPVEFLLAVVLAFAGSGATLQERVLSASPGDTIRVLQGTHRGNLIIDKRLTVIGEPGAVISGDGVGSTITVASDSVEIAGLIVEHCGSDLARDDSGIKLKASHCVIRNNAIRDVLFGVYFLEADSNRVFDNRITSRVELESGERGSGMHLFNSHRNEIFNNVITDARDGFYIQNSSHTLFSCNEVSRVRYGLHYMNSDSNIFFDNTFTHNVAGAAVMYSNGIIIRRNRFLHNRGFASYGILFQDCRGLVVDSNLVIDNETGLFFEATTQSSFRHNVIAGNDVAIRMFQNSPGNVIAENNFIENLNPLVIIGKRTETRWEVDGRGNFWSSYDGYDLNGDGTGDVPMKVHNIFEYLEGRLPMARLYLYSPASQALAAATEAFPILALNEEEDTRPLMKPIDLSSLQANPSARKRVSASDALLILLLAGFFAGGGVWKFRRWRRNV